MELRKEVLDALKLNQRSKSELEQGSTGCATYPTVSN